MMRKARSSKEKTQEPVSTVASEELGDDERPRRRRGKTVNRLEDGEKPNRRRTRGEENGEQEPVRPILTAIPRPSDDSSAPPINAPEEPPAALQRAPTPALGRASCSGRV